ncbi:unnamed protein product [Closterium sp. NIES-54]
MLYRHVMNEPPALKGEHWSDGVWSRMCGSGCSGVDISGLGSGGTIWVPFPGGAPMTGGASVPGGASMTGDASASGAVPLTAEAAASAAAAVVEGGVLTSAAVAAGNIDIDLVTVAPRGRAASSPSSFYYSRLNSSPLLTSGSARLLPSSLRLTPLSPPHQAGLALHPTPFPLVSPANPTSPCRPYSFSSFSFHLSSPHPAALGADGFAFVLLPDPTVGLPGPNMGYGRRPYKQEELFLGVEGSRDEQGANSNIPTNYYVGMNVDYRMTSAGHSSVNPAGIPWLGGNKKLHAWVAYNAAASLLSVRLSSSPAMPPSALLSLPFNACDLFHIAPKEDGGEREAVLVL